MDYFRFMHSVAIYTQQFFSTSSFTGSKASDKLYDIIIGNTRLLANMKKSSPSHRTSSLDAYHSVVNLFAPKLLAFSYGEIYSR